MQRTKTNKLKSSSLQVGLRCRSPLRLPGSLLRWILLLLCHSRHGRRPGPQKTTTLQHNKRAASLGWGFAALANAPYGVLLPGYSNTGSTKPPPPQVFSCSGSSSEGSKTAAGGSAGRGSKSAAARAETLKKANGKILFSQLGKLCRVRLSCLLFPVDGSK